MRCSWEPTGSVTALALSCMAGVALVTSCEDSRQESTGFAAERASLTEGRRFDVLIPSSSSGMERLEVRIGDDSDGHYADLTERLSAACNDAVGARANSITTTMADGRALGATADLAAHSLCMGHEWMNLATAPNITDFYGDGSFTARPQLDEEETRTEQLERLIGTRGLDISLPVPSNRSAATFAYLAVDSFREAALTGAEILELAPTNSLDATVRAAAEDGSGLSDDPTDTTPLADAIVFLTAEATQRMIEAARMAGGLSSNEAQARLAERGGDRADNTMASWVSAHDSRYETAGMWMGWPDCSCCEVSLSTCPDPEMCSLAWCAHADDYAGPTIDDCACCANDPETCPKPEICDPGAFCGPGGGGGVCTPTANAEDDTAIEIIASLGVLPPIQTTEQAVLDELADAVRADDPNAPPDLDARDLLESRYGISAASFLRGWRHTHERIGALGLPLARRADGSGLSRYSGMRAIPTPEQLAAYTSARTIGPNRFDYQAALTAEGAYRGSTTHIVPFAYGRQGVLPALDVIGTALRHALARPELAPTEVVPGRPEPDGARRMAHAALSLARSMVAQRIKLRVGRRNTDGFDRMELTCYGCTGRSSTYALVVGEAGLHCATTHAIAGEPCDLEDYRVNVTPTVLSESVHSGIAGQHLVFTINASHLPPGVAVGGRIPSVHFYLTELVGASRRVLTTFAPVEGPNAGTYSRTTYIPVVAQGMQVATAQAVPSTEECDEPRECCDGLPCDPMLPRESELVTDRLGENRYESIDEALYRTALDAATYADALGVEAIQQQLVADQAAHGARDELEALCGGAINVEMLGPAQCNTDEDCGGSPGSCVPSDHLCTLASAISMQEGPDTSSIEACIGNFLVHVNFGSTGLCYFQAIDPLGDPQTFIPLRTPCVCLDSDATCEDTLFELGCPREPDDGGCSDAYPALGANYLVGATTALNETESAGGDDSPRCDLLPVLRSGSTEGVRMEAAEELLQQEWLRELTFSELGERVGFKPDLLQTGRATIDGAGWYATGSVHFGPTPEGFPCDAHAIATDYGTGDPIDECEPGAGSDFTFGRPLLCGVGSCGSVANRIEMNYRLYDAATLIAILGRASGRYLYRPGYKGYNDDVGFEVSADRWTPSVDDPDYYDEPFSGWEAQSFGPLPGMVAVVGDRALFRACASEEVCATTDLPSYYGLVPLPNDVLPDWHGVENGSGDLFVGQIIRALDDANHGDDSTGLGGDQPALQNGPLGDLLDPWIWLPLFHPGTAPEFQYEVQCVRIDNPSGGLGEAAYAFGAVCPTLFAPVPADLASLGAQRTSPQSISDFWDHTPGEGATYTVHDLVYDVARRTRGDGGPPIGQWSVALAGLKELGRQLGNAEDENEVPNPQETPYGRVLDALELACLAAYEEGAGSCGTDVSQTPQIEGPDDFPELERALDCAASSIERGIENAVLFDVPHEILQDVQSDQISTTYPELQGEYGEATASLRSSVETVTLATNQIASAARQLSTDIGIARQQLIIADLEEDLAVAQAQAQQAANVGSCINSAGEAAEALNSGAQIIPLIIGLVTGCIADALAAKAAFDAEDIAEDLNNAQSEIILLELQAQFGHQMDSIASAGTLMIQGYAQMQQALTQLDTIRNQAASAAMVVLGYTLDPLSGRENNYLQAQRRWTSLWRARYEHAFANARRNAWYARHALEARIGMDLSEMNNQLALVEPPALWADRLCTMTALNYDELRVVGDEVEQSDPYDNGFLSDYVRRLGLVKDSYPLDFDYQDERDTAVISVRDEIFNEVLQCDVTGHNQLFEAADPSVVHAGGIGGWFPAFEANGYGIDSSPIPGSPFEQYLLDENTLVSKALGGATAQLMSSTDPVDELDPLARRPSWAQTLSLPPGRWALSWSEELPESNGLTCAGMTSPTETQLEPELISQNAVVVQLEAEYLTSTEDTQSHPCWRRVRMIFQNPVAQDVMIGFAIRETPSAVNPLPSVRWAAPQLESVALTAMPSTILPTSFFPTDDDLAAFIGLCEDTNGDRLRTHFTYQCEPICPPEFGDHCSGGQYCYWESNFVIDIEALMNGENAQFGGIAARSYNHRLQSLALNLVGTNVRDCERSSLPSVCYASGFLPYSLRLERGSIRNHFGEPVFPPYSPADVEFARALATERYVSNPISSADQSLLAGFWRRSFQGYPLSAHYRLRIVDVDELAWERVRDIQLVVEYSAWRNQN